MQLLCLWVGTAMLGLTNGRSLWGACPATSLAAALAAQVLLGFALPTALVYLHERRQRQVFLESHLD